MMSLSIFKGDPATLLHDVEDELRSIIPSSPLSKRHRIARPLATDRVVHRRGGLMQINL